MLRQLHIVSKMKCKSQEIKDAVDLLVTLIEENLNGTYEPLPRTVRLFLAIEEKDHCVAQNLLENYPESNHFLSNLILIPGSIFPDDSEYHRMALASPIGIYRDFLSIAF